MRVAFRVDATELIGGGHVMRCLTLADALREEGAETSFVCAALPAALGDRLVAAGHALHMIAAPDGLERDGEDWHEPPLPVEAQARDVAATLAALGGPADWIVVDHYLLGATWHSAARRGAERILVIDDLANRLLDCDLLLDQTFGRGAADYRQLVPASAQVLAGASYALLRPEFARERPAALERRKRGGPVERILISLGTTDVGGITASVLDAVVGSTGDCAIDVVLGSKAPSLARVGEFAARNDRVSLHVDAADMAALMRDADIAVGAGGMTALERCALGLPSVILPLADNQIANARAIERAGAGLVSDDWQRVPVRLDEILRDQRILRDMSTAASNIIDGGGTDRVVVQMINDRVRERIAG